MRTKAPISDYELSEDAFNATQLQTINNKKPCSISDMQKKVYYPMKLFDGFIQLMGQDYY